MAQDGGRSTEDGSRAAEDGADVSVDAKSWWEDGSTSTTNSIPCSTFSYRHSYEYEWFSLYLSTIKSYFTHAISSSLCRINRRHRMMGLKTQICRSGRSGHLSEYFWLWNNCMDLLAFVFVDYLRLWMNDIKVYLHLWITCDYMNCLWCLLWYMCDACDVWVGYHMHDQIIKIGKKKI